MKAKHTPGPWKAAWPLVNAHGGNVADVNTIEERGEADARLIAAAPDLLAALESLLAEAVKVCKLEECEEDDAMRAARAAISKAKGESR